MTGMKSEFVWNPEIHEICGEQLHFFFIRYQSKSIEFKQVVQDSLIQAKVVHPSIFKLFGKWDVLIRFWSDSIVAEEALRRLSSSSEIRSVEYYKAEAVTYFWVDESVGNVDVKRNLEDIELNPDIFASLQEVGYKHDAFELYKEKGFLLDAANARTELWRFYITVRLDDGSNIIGGNGNLIQQVKQNSKGVEALTLHIGFGHIANLLFKGEADSPKVINAFLEYITELLGDENPVTQTIIVAGIVGPITDFIDVSRARDRWDMQCMDRCYPELNLESLPGSVRHQLQFKCLEFEEDGVIKRDRERLMGKVFEARVEGSKNPLEKVFELPAKVEGQLRRNLPQLMKESYGQEWFENDYNRILQSLNISKNKKPKSLSLRETMSVLAEVIIEKKIINIPLSDAQLKDTMAKWCELRNHLYHDSDKKAIQGWNRIFDYMKDFISVYYPLMDYLDGLEDA